MCRFRTTHSPILSALTALTALALSFCPLSGQAQIGQTPAPPRPLSGNRGFNPFSLTFKKAWEVRLADPVKLIEVAPVLEDKKNSLLWIVGGKDHNDYRRKLVATHWDGFRFAEDGSVDFIGTAVDVLLAGKFRTDKATILPQFAATPPSDKTKDSNGKNTDAVKAAAGSKSTDTKPAKPVKTKGSRSLPVQQIVTTAGVYRWNGSAFTYLFASPPNLKLSLRLEDTPDQMVIGSGDGAALYEAGESDSHPSSFELAMDDPGYAHFGIGNQTYKDAKDWTPNVRYAQSHWNARQRWQIGLLKGTPKATDDAPDATSGDILVVYAPTLSNREKTFWQLTRPDDWEENWRSDPLSGRVLDVRVGDPKNEGREGILVLTAEDNDKTRKLTFFLPAANGNVGLPIR